ncbi:MAG: hypothetical protein WCZ23_11160 [Rhodospirillaceae bacterium]
MSAHLPSPGKVLITMDLPKATHALLFDRHAGLRVDPEKDGVRITFAEGGASVEILLDDQTLKGLLDLIAEARRDG